MLQSLPPASPPRERGFTLLEVLIAMLLVAMIAMGLAQLFAIAMISTERARHQTSSTVLAVQKMEQLRSLTWTFASGIPISDLTTDLGSDPASASGPGLGVSPSGTLAASTPGYVDYLDAHGRWVGAGAVLPPGVVYIRRWSVETLPSDPDTLLLQVLVTTVRRDNESVAMGGIRGRLRGDALVATLRSRKAALS